MSDAEIETQADEVVRGVLGTMLLEGSRLSKESVAKLRQYIIDHIRNFLAQSKDSNE